MEIAKRLPLVVGALQNAISRNLLGNTGELRFPVQDIFTADTVADDGETEAREILIELLNQAFVKTGKSSGLKTHIGLDGDDLVLVTSDLQRLRDSFPTIEYFEQSVAARIDAASRPSPRFR